MASEELLVGGARKECGDSPGVVLLLGSAAVAFAAGDGAVALRAMLIG